MDRRNFLRQCALVAGASVFGANSHALDTAQDDRVNVLFLVIDDLTLGCWAIPTGMPAR
jgi:hypothetical protein